jgi:hypothetical protein
MKTNATNWTMWLSVTLLAAQVAASVMTLSFYRNDSAYRILVATNRILVVLSLCVGSALIVREVRRGRLRNAIWPTVLVLLTATEVALVVIGEILLPDPN